MKTTIQDWLSRRYFRRNHRGDGYYESCILENTGDATNLREELHEAWAAIKKEEKKGREWEADYLEGALNEASELIEKAKERKGFKSK